MDSMIRKAQDKDSEAIRDLLDQLGYPQTVEFIAQKLKLLTDSPNDEVYVYVYENRVIGFITLHYAVQLAFEKDFCEIGYFVVDKDFRSLKIGDKLESFACGHAKERKCCEMFVFSQIKRTDAHRFYLRQGYKQIEKYFEKIL